MASTGRQESKPGSPLGIPWPLWVMFISYISAGIVIFEKVNQLERHVDQHMLEDGHRVMEQNMARIQEKVDRNTQDIREIVQ